MDKLTTSEVAALKGWGQSTVNLWCRQGKFPNAEFNKTPQGGYWLIPKSDLENFTPPQMGRRPRDRKIVNKKGGKK